MSVQEDIGGSEHAADAERAEPRFSDRALIAFIVVVDATCVGVVVALWLWVRFT